MSLKSFDFHDLQQLCQSVELRSKKQIPSIRAAPNSPILLRQVIILLAKKWKQESFCLCKCFVQLPSRIPCPTNTVPHRPSVQFQYPSHIHPFSMHPHQVMSYPAQESLPPFPGKAGPFPQEAAHKAQKPSKSTFIFNETLLCQQSCV